MCALSQEICCIFLEALFIKHTPCMTRFQVTLKLNYTRNSEYYQACTLTIVIMLERSYPAPPWLLISCLWRSHTSVSLLKILLSYILSVSQYLGTFLVQYIGQSYKWSIEKRYLFSWGITKELFKLHGIWKGMFLSLSINTYSCMWWKCCIWFSHKYWFCRRKLAMTTWWLSQVIKLMELRKQLFQKYLKLIRTTRTCLKKDFKNCYCWLASIWILTGVLMRSLERILLRDV